MSFNLQRDEHSAPFFDATARGQLLIRRCPRCDEFYPPHQRHCIDGTELEWAPTSGQATLVTWVVDHGAVIDPALAGADGATSVAGMVEFPEGPWMSVALVGVDLETLRVGDALEAHFLRLGDESVPVFGPVGRP